MTSVSVVVPTRGGARTLPLLLTSLREQTHPDWEAVVVVDGDVDGSADLVAREARDLPVRTLVLPENRGRSAALNAGFSLAEGDVLVRSDDDLGFGPAHLARHAAHHEAAAAPIGLVGLCRNVYPDGGSYARAYGVPTDARFRAAAYAAPADRTWRYWAANVSVTSETWRTIGPYDESYRAYGWEDVDWGYRLRRAGIPVEIHADVEAEHHGAAATTEDRALRAFYSGAARQHFLRTHDLGDGAALLGDTGAGDGLWGRAVLSVAAITDERRLRRLGDVVDRINRALPRPAAEKLVALLVEGAAVAGHRAGRTAGAI
ncbi:glycosyltransferase family 2 protein [Nocardioides bigeumensis]|uniref:Glycosyltransferase family 2 protein n=1 Tax=Nocardioides bigeumensis TaxID=433657 RepID=A0ABP5K4J4_9ACTN